MQVKRLPSLARHILGCLAVAAGFLPSHVLSQVPESGSPVAAFAPVDVIIQQLMEKYDVPGAEVAISYDGRLVYARGYGFAKVETRELVQPYSLFRVASNSKQFTATGILRLIEQGKISLETKPFATVFTDLSPQAGRIVDRRLLDITIKELLEHKGGWDDTITGVTDPVFENVVIAASTFGASAPATPELLIRYMLGQKLQHDPGSVYAYSNFGYVVLGAVIARVSGQSYQKFIKDQVLEPLGLVHVRHGGSLLSDRLPEEVQYYDYARAPLINSVIPPVGTLVLRPYGDFSMDLMEANGGWLASAIDLVRYADVMNGQLQQKVLKSPPPGAVGYIPPLGRGYVWHFYGSLPGSNSLNHLDTSHYSAAVTWAAVFNTRTALGSQPQTEADGEIGQALLVVRDWPKNDLFSTFP